MNSFKDSLLCAVLKALSALCCALPHRMNMGLASMLGFWGYYLLPKKRSVVEFNLKKAFGSTLDEKSAKPLVKIIFKNLTATCVDMLALPRFKAKGFKNFVKVEGIENIQTVMAEGRGCIVLAVHSGSWELGSVVGSMHEFAYNIVAKEQKRTPQINALLTEIRRQSGAKVIPPGSATRDIVRALHKKEIVCLVVDQGGKDGLPVEFLGRTASMATGAIKLALKYNVPLCPVWIERQTDGRNILKLYPPISLEAQEDKIKELCVNTQKAVRVFEQLIKDNPREYLWFYKVYKYSTQADVLIIDDGKTGHLRQSQGLVKSLEDVLSAQKNQKIILHTYKLEFKRDSSLKALNVYCFLAQFVPFLRRQQQLKLFLTEDCYQQLLAIPTDYAVSCGSVSSSVNFLLSDRRLTKTIQILKPGLLNWNCFSLMLLPEHDRGVANIPPTVKFTRAAINLITPAYLEQQENKLLLRYSHLKGNTRPKIGVLIGGNTKGIELDTSQIRILIRQLKEAATHYNMDLLITSSRRTPAAIDELLSRELRNFNRCPLLIIPNENNIPETVGGILSLSDIVLVSGESISMVSEALSSGKKVIVFAAQGNYSAIPLNKYDRFVFDLNQKGYLLAVSIKNISDALNRVFRQKVSSKINDREIVLKALGDLV